ncbi:MAG: 2-C-methyl-D-erythritol 2,4-cyclodiphosphate synthase [Acidimicrobiia bacterium]|nr:2-C-methyl-D-erythritol 2,4-cyclodiphosphate synthase [Acidimicrobiia bacterium]
MRIGWGFDAHRIGSDGPMTIAGVVVAEDRGLIATSDGDVALHAVGDAILGAAALGDLGTHFPSSDEQWQGADSVGILSRIVEMAREAGLLVDSVDVTVIAQSVRIAPHREAMRRGLAEVLELPPDRVSVKATTTDGMGYLGSDEGVAAVAVAVLN